MKNRDGNVKRTIKRRIEVLKQVRETKMGVRDKLRASAPPPKPIPVGLVTRNEIRRGTISKSIIKYKRKMINNIGILVVNYNNLNYTKDCINDLQNQINKNFEIWLIDQNSDEVGTIEYLSEIEKQGIKVIRNDSNVDLNSLWNFFYKNCESKYLCYLNNDVRVAINFTDDIINLFSRESQVGIIIHVTNNLKYIKSDLKIKYDILNPPLSQGWDFCIRKEVYTEIPNTLRIFGGDDFIFANVVKKGYNVGFLYSSPVIHYKERTRVKITTIAEIQKNDAKNYWEEVSKLGLRHCNSAVNLGLCNKFPPDGIKLIQNKNCIYTTMIGDYDDIGESTGEKQDGWDYICFTDNENLTSDFWNVIYIPNIGDSEYDNVKLARYFKTNYHKYLSSYDNVIWKDGRIIINCDLNNYLGFLGENDILFMKHNEANSIEEEFKRVLSGKLESDEVVKKIKMRYAENDYKYDNGLFATGIILLKNNERTKNFFETWWNEIELFSHRDQLSVNYALFKTPELKYHMLPQNKVLSANGYFLRGRRKVKRFTYN